MAKKRFNRSTNVYGRARNNAPRTLSLADWSAAPPRSLRRSRQGQSLVRYQPSFPTTTVLRLRPFVGLRPATFVTRPPSLPAKQGFRRNALESPFKRIRALYQLPATTLACLRRKARREVLMALGGGSGPRPKDQKPRRYNAESDYKC